MRLRKAENTEFEAIRDFYWKLIDEMSDQNDTVGWKKGIYPSDRFLRSSIDSGELYLLDGENGYMASVILNDSWNDGYEGVTWGMECSRDEILVPHALAVDPALQGRGTGTAVVKDILELASTTGKKTVRLDILKGNTAAERLYTDVGFRYVQTKDMYYEDTGWTEYMMFEIMIDRIK